MMENVKRTNNPNGRPVKDNEPRSRTVTVRLTPTAADALASAAKLSGCSQSDIIEDYLIGCIKFRLASELYSNKVPDWCDRQKK